MQVASLRNCFSEYALIKFRMLVECRWIQLLSSLPDLPEVPRFSPEAAAVLEELCADFSLQTAHEVKDVERTTNHDVKAVEYVLKRRMSANPELQKVLEFTHFACTSEDINNLAHGLMLKQARDQLLLPTMDSIVEALCHLAEEHAGAHAATHPVHQCCISCHMNANPEVRNGLALTRLASKDINNLAHGLVLMQAPDQLLLMAMDSIVEALCHSAEEHAGARAAQPGNFPPPH
jgi:adenylosuccinate lyase